jgi:hypothetical protein
MDQIVEAPAPEAEQQVQAVDPELLKKLVGQEYTQAIAGLDVIVIDVKKKPNGVEVTVADRKTTKHRKTELINPRFYNPGILKEAAIWVVTESTKKPALANDATPAIKEPRPPVSGEQLALVPSKYRDPVEMAGLIIVDVDAVDIAGTDQKTLLGIIIADPGGKAEKSVRLDSDGEEERLEGAIQHVQWILTRDEDRKARAIPQTLRDSAEKFGVGFRGNPERITGRQFRVEIYSRAAPSRRLTFTYDVDHIDDKKLTEFEGLARDIAEHAARAVSENATKVVTVNSQPKKLRLQDIKPAFRREAERLGITLHEPKGEDGKIHVILRPKTITVTLDGKPQTFDGSFFSAPFVIDGKRGVTRRLQKAVIDLTERATRQKQESLEFERRTPTFGRVHTDRNLLGRANGAQVPEPDLTGVPLYRYPAGRMEVSLLHVPLDGPEAIERFQEMTAEIVKTAEARNEELAMKVATPPSAEAATVQSSADPQRIEGLPEIYYAAAEEIGVTIRDHTRGRDRNLQSITFSETRTILTVGVKATQKTFEFKGGLITSPPFVFKPGQNLDDPKQVQRFKKAAQSVVESAKKARQPTAEAALRSRQLPLGVIVVPTPRQRRRSPRHDVTSVDAAAPAA